jgi:hypothetical protein
VKLSRWSFRVSLRLLLVLVTLVCIFLALGVYLYEERYARNLRGHQYFESLGAWSTVGDPCPKDFVFYLDGTCRGDGLQITNTPDFLEQLAGRRLSFPAVRELSFRRDTYLLNHKFDLATADNLVRLAPYLESLELPPVPHLCEVGREREIDAIVNKLRDLNDLRVLSFLKWPITDEHVVAVATMERLQVVQLARADRLTDRSLETLANMKHLRFLTLQSEGVSQAMAEQFHKSRPDVVCTINGHQFGDQQMLYMNRKKR